MVEKGVVLEGGVFPAGYIAWANTEADFSLKLLLATVFADPFC